MVLPTDWDFAAELKPFQYNVVTTRGIKRMRYPFDAVICADGSAEWAAAVEFFAGVNPVKSPGFTPRTRKGLLRIWL